jgi:hypothetical protein
MKDRSQGGFSRREFLWSVIIGGSGCALASCRGPGIFSQPPITPTPDATATSYPQGDHPIISDVLDYSLSSDEWPGAFGWVKIRLHQAIYEGRPAYFIRTDCSDETYARENGLVWMPLLFAGNDGDFENKLFVFDDGRLPVMRSVPGDPDYISLFEIVRVSGGQDREFTSVAELRSASENELIELNPSGIHVNFPVVHWPNGELPVDTELDSYLGTGQLIEPIDFDDMTITFKLHEGFPGSRYILTHTSAIDRAGGMHIAPAAASWATVEYYATDEVFVFANGIEGSGVLGYQPGVFGSAVDSLVSSPFWNHFTVRWVYEENARILRDADEVYDAIERGELQKFNGLIETHPNGFVVNCPIVVLADNSFG